MKESTENASQMSPFAADLTATPSVVLSLGNARGALSKATNTTFLELFRRGSLAVEIWKPEGVDTQQPHGQDELYFVVGGEGEFVHSAQRNRVQAGDVLFVAAQTPHRFENFSADFTVWVVFYGPEGGEKNQPGTDDKRRESSI
jgi:mannose-6-phosphate isomerase-like protein (cupin superfamily)